MTPHTCSDFLFNALSFPLHLTASPPCPPPPPFAARSPTQNTLLVAGAAPGPRPQVSSEPSAPSGIVCATAAATSSLAKSLSVQTGSEDTLCPMPCTTTSLGPVAHQSGVSTAAAAAGAVLASPRGVPSSAGTPLVVAHPASSDTITQQQMHQAMGGAAQYLAVAQQQQQAAWRQQQQQQQQQQMQQQQQILQLLGNPAGYPPASFGFFPGQSPYGEIS